LSYTSQTPNMTIAYFRFSINTWGHPLNMVAIYKNIPDLVR